MEDSATRTTTSTDPTVDDYSQPLDWEATGGRLRPFDDGHIPELFAPGKDGDDNTDYDNHSTKLVEYPSLFERQPSIVRVYQNAFSDEWVDALYQKTRTSDHPAWGDYVTIEKVRQYWKEQEEGKANDKHDDDDEDENLLVKVVARYLELALKQENETSTGDYQLRRLGGSDEDTSCDSLFTAKDLELAHGVAIWSLRSLAGSEVDYHLDYAEQIRYHSNIIVPPLLAGTLQCTRDKLDGGDFRVATQGIPHYEKHGYKAKKQALMDENDDDMIEIQYRYNQMICHLGNLPHSSTKVNTIHGNQERVVYGFNVLCRTAGPLVEKAPEHSEQFRRAIQLQRYLRQKTKMKSQMSLEQVKKNKALSKLLVLAKRERVKNEYKLARERLESEVPARLPATVAELMDYFSHDATQPVPLDDIRVFLHHSIQQGQFKIVNDCVDSIDGLVSPLAELACV